MRHLLLGGLEVLMGSCEGEELITVTEVKTKMSKPAVEHANKILEYRMKAKESLNIKDVNFTKNVESEQQTETESIDPWDALIKAEFDKGFPGGHNFKPGPAKKTIVKQLDPIEEIFRNW
jgi:hypothetical protein